MATKAQVQLIDEFYVPYEIDRDDPETPGRVTYWGFGYPTEREARRAIEATEFGDNIPEGVRVDFNSGRRID